MKLTKENIDRLVEIITPVNLPDYVDTLVRLRDKLDVASPEQITFLELLFQEILLEMGTELHSDYSLVK